VKAVKTVTVREHEENTASIQLVVDKVGLEKKTCTIYDLADGTFEVKLDHMVNPPYVDRQSVNLDKHQMAALAEWLSNRSRLWFPFGSGKKRLAEAMVDGYRPVLGYVWPGNGRWAWVARKLETFLAEGADTTGTATTLEEAINAADAVIDAP
jgi:hypothetical protein